MWVYDAIFGATFEITSAIFGPTFGSTFGQELESINYMHNKQLYNWLFIINRINMD